MWQHRCRALTVCHWEAAWLAGCALTTNRGRWAKATEAPHRRPAAFASCGLLTAAKLWPAAACIFTLKKKKHYKRTIHYLVRSKWWATTTAPLHTRPETMTEIFEHTKSQAKFPAERVKRKPPAVSQSVLRRDGMAWCQNLWRAIKCVDATNTHSDPQPYSSTEDQTLCSNSTWLLLESTESQSDLVMFLLLQQLALNPSWPWLFSKDL